MMKKYFSGKLYVEGLRQLRLQGIVLGIISVAGCGLTPLLYLLRYYSGEMDDMGVIPFSIMELTGLFTFLMFLLPIVFCGALFGYLNRRNASDFYHAIPKTRLCVFFSYLAAIYTYYLAILILTLGAVGILYGINPHTIYDKSYPVYLFFAYLASLTLLTGCVIFAKAVTGTTISNLTVTGLLLCFPRVLMLCFISMVTDVAYIVPTDGLFWLSDTSYNIPFHTLYSTFLWSSETAVDKVPSIVYTLILGIVYLALGAWLLYRRKSEVAENSAPSPLLQHVIRILVGVIIPIWYTTVVVTAGVEASDLLMVGFFTLLIYFGYELITTKKAKNLLKAIPGLAVIVVFCVGLGGLSVAYGNRLLHTVPERSKVTAFSLDMEMDYWQLPSYHQLRAAGCRIVDEEVLDFLFRDLEYTIELVENGETNKLYGGSQGNRGLYRITLYTKDGKLTRNISVTDEEYEKISAAYLASEEYKQALASFPDLASVDDVYGLSLVDGRVLLETYRKEYLALTAEEQAYHCGMSYTYGIPEGVEIDFEEIMDEDFDDWKEDTEISSGYDYELQLFVTGYYEGQAYRSVFNLTSKTPESTKLYMNLRQKAGRKRFQEVIEETKDAEKWDYWGIYGDNGIMYLYLSFEHENGDAWGKLEYHAYEEDGKGYTTYSLGKTEILQLLELYLKYAEEEVSVDASNYNNAEYLSLDLYDSILYIHTTEEFFAELNGLLSDLPSEYTNWYY